MCGARWLGRTFEEEGRRSNQASVMNDLILFLGFLAFFHVSEFCLVLIYNRKELSLDSWLISKPYCLAMSFALLEYNLEKAFIQDSKGAGFIRAAGIAITSVGELVRKAAIISAKSSFTLSIKAQRQPEHHLIKSGIYRHCRHPGYLGWMIWSVGTQVLLQNPICFLIFAYWSWMFFKERIPYEEELLLEMFGSEYRDYAEKTRIWLPFIASPIQYKRT